MNTIFMQRTNDFLYDFIYSILSYQFDKSLASIFLEIFEQMTFKFSRNTKKLKYIFLNSQLQVSYLPKLGTFSLTIDAVNRIYKKIPFPKFRVQILSEISDFIKQGKSVFAKHTIEMDPNLLVGNQVFVVDEDDILVAIGKLCIPPHYAKKIKNGVAVDIKKGINQ